MLSSKGNQNNTQPSDPDHTSKERIKNYFEDKVKHKLFSLYGMTRENVSN